MSTAFDALRPVLRSLIRSKTYAMATLLTLVLTLAQVIAVLTVVDQVLLRPLPYTDANRLAIIWEHSRSGDTRLPSYPEFLDLEEHARSYLSLGYLLPRGVDIVTPGGAIRAGVGNVSPGFFRMLGARTAHGRLFTADEERRGRGDVVVLSYDLWQRAFGGDPAIVGRSIRVGQATERVIGILPRGVGYPAWVSLWRPIGAIYDNEAMLRNRGGHADGRLIVRLRPGTTVASVVANLSAVQARWASADPGDADWTLMDVVPLEQDVVGDVTVPLRVLAAASMLIWLLMCLNISNLAVARGMRQARERAVQIALGATGARLAWQTLVEGILLALTGGVFGTALGAWVVRLVAAGAVPGLPRTQELTMDARIVAAAVMLAVLTGIAASVLPALRIGREGAMPALQFGRGSTSGRRESRVRGVLTVGQFGLALVLVVGAGLLVNTLGRLARVSLGFNPNHVITFYIFPPASQYGRPEQAAELYRTIIGRASAVPGMEAAAVVNTPPLTGGNVITKVVRPDAPLAVQSSALYFTVSDGYLRTMGLHLLRGRWFTATDMATASDGVVIDAAMAARDWPNQDPIGRPVTLFRASANRPGYGQPMPSVVIGVVDDVRQFGFTDTPGPEVYVPYTREVWPGIALEVRTTLSPSSAIAALRGMVSQLLPDIPFDNAVGDSGFRPLVSFAEASLAVPRYLARLVAVFAASAVLLAVIGITA